MPAPHDPRTLLRWIALMDMVGRAADTLDDHDQVLGVAVAVRTPQGETIHVVSDGSGRDPGRFLWTGDDTADTAELDAIERRVYIDLGIPDDPERLGP